MIQLRTFSYGGGVQSTAALVLAAQGAIDFPIFLFCNVGDDSEHPATLAYVENVAKPYARAQKIELIELRHMRKDGTEQTLYQRMTKDGSKSVDIPAYMFPSGMPSGRTCTQEFKINQINRWLKENGVVKTAPARMGLDISIDEYQRMKTDDPAYPLIQKEYPLINLRLSRQDCMNVIERAGLAVPPKSACWFCPYHRIKDWQTMKRTTPALFDRAIKLEQSLLSQRARLGKEPIFLTSKLRPLDSVIGDQSDMFDDVDDACESGYCMT